MRGLIDFTKYNARFKEKLKNSKCFVLDLDGTFYLSDRLIEGSLEFIDILRQTGRKPMFFTNNSSKNAAFYETKLSALGCSLESGEVVTSNSVIVRYISENRRSKKVFVLGTKYLKDDFINAGIKLSEDAPDIVAAGLDTTLDYEKAAKACRFLSAGAEFFGANPDLCCPIENGFIPDCGSICAMLSSATGVKPRFFGKPSAESLEYILSVTGLEACEVVFVGDRLYTDIAMAEGNKAMSLLVLTGETKPGDIEASPIKPDFVFPSLKEAGQFMLGL